MLVGHERAVELTLANELCRLRIHLRRRRVASNVEGGLGSVDGQKGRGVLSHVGACLRVGEDVVGQGGELGSALGNGPQAGQRLNVHAVSLAFWVLAAMVIAQFWG